jgi:hypothetical protein
LHHRFQRLTLDIIVSALFGLERGPRFETLRDKLASAIAYGDSFVSLLTPAQDSRLLPLFGRAGPFAAFKRDQGVADELIFEVIDERRREGSDGDDILTMLLEARHEDGTPMSDQELRDEMMTLMVAGHDGLMTFHARLSDAGGEFSRTSVPGRCSNELPRPFVAARRVLDSFLPACAGDHSVAKPPAIHAKSREPSTAASRPTRWESGCRRVAASACHAEGRGFESLQPLRKGLLIRRFPALPRSPRNTVAPADGVPDS